MNAHTKVHGKHGDFAIEARHLVKRFKSAKSYIEVLKGMNFDASHGDLTTTPSVSYDPEQPNFLRVGVEHTPERDLLLLCLHFESIGKPLSLSIPHDWIDLGHPAGALLNRFLGEFEHDLWPGKDHLENLLESDAERSLVASLLFETPGFEEPTKVAQEGLKLLRARALEPRLREIELALANPHADIESDPISLLKERSELHRLLRQPIALAASA